MEHQYRPNGLALLVSVLASLVIMMLHPTAADLLGANPEAARRTNTLVHSVALAAMPLQVFGLLGLWRRLAPSDWSTFALVAFVFGAITVTSAAVASGFVAPSVVDRIREAGSDATIERALLRYTGTINRGYETVTIMAWSAAIVAWSIAILSTKRFNKATGWLGVVAGPVVPVGFLADHLHLHVHGVLAITAIQGVWLVAVAVGLLRSKATASAG